MQESTVSKFAGLLGTVDGSASASTAGQPLTPAGAAARSRDILSCLSNAVESHEVICTLPSLDMRKVEDENGMDLLPRVGEHRGSSGSGAGAGAGAGGPQMEASVLNSAPEDSAKAAQVEQKAAQSLGSLTSWTKSSIMYSSGAISQNIADSFSALVDSRVRAWTLLLLRHSLTTGDSTSRSRLLSMLSSIVKVNSAQTKFKTFPLPESAAGQLKEVDVILPLLLEVDIQIAIQGASDSVTLRAPGTISADFDKDLERDSRIVKADVRLDTGALLDSMVQQARMVVFKAVAKATAATEGLPDADEHVHVQPQPTIDEATSTANALSNFSTALSLSPEAPKKEVPPGPNQSAHRLQKARSSALKLNSVLQGDTGTSNEAPGPNTKYRKSRSVQWDHQISAPKMKNPTNPTPKRQRLAQTSARLTSFKSFGRPHAGDFGSGPRNATFGDFGRKPIWGRDGKLANHPMPMQSSEHREEDLFADASSNKNTRNATFDFQRPPIHLSSGLDLGSGQNKSSLNQVPNSIPRTATALEGWLMRNTNPSGKGNSMF